MEDALEFAGLRLAGSRPGAPSRVRAVFRPALVSPRVHVSLRFDPPIHVSSCKRIVERVTDRFTVVAVSVHKARAPLPRKSD